MSTSVQPQQPCHIDRLPAETIHNILGHLAFPAPLHRLSPAQFGERQSDLLAVCLVSKRLKSACQPMLWDQVEAATVERWRWFTGEVEAPASRARACRALRVGSAEDGVVLSKVDFGGARLPGLEELVLHPIGVVSLPDISCVANLRLLTLNASNSALSATDGAVLPRLEALQLRSIIFFKTGYSPSFFSSRCLPRLRHLSLEGCTTMGLSDAPTIFPLDFVRQLDSIQLHIFDFAALRQGILPHNDLAPVLWRVDLVQGFGGEPNTAAPFALCVAHLIVEVSAYVLASLGPDADDDSPDWSTILVGALEPRSALPDLRLLLLPRPLWSSPHGATRTFKRKKKAVVADCARRGIEIRTYEPARALEGGIVVPEFLEYRREQRATAAAASAAQR
ncbi:hypothetical protein JCM8208_003000 [Rhodotorula glutinis]